MRTIVVVLSLMALATSSSAVQSKPSLEKQCRQLAGKEVPEATDGRSHEGQMNVQRFSDCMMGLPR